MRIITMLFVVQEVVVVVVVVDAGVFRKEGGSETRVGGSNVNEKVGEGRGAVEMNKFVVIPPTRYGKLS